MAKKFKCGHCDYVAHGETEKELMDDIGRHNKKAHDMEMTEDIKKKVRAGMQEE